MARTINETTCKRSSFPRRDTSLPSEIKELQTPMQIFCYFFTKEMMQLIREETNRAALIENVNTQFMIDVDELYHYIGILIFISVYRYPNLKSYWGKNTFTPIQMSRKRFEAIKKYLLFRDASERIKKVQLGYDPLFRARVMANELNKRFDSVPKHFRLCVNPQ